MNGDLEKEVGTCHAILSEMIKDRIACSNGHPLYRAMRALKKRYSGSFPNELQALWDDVRTPIHPDAVVQYHMGIPRLKGWFQRQFSIKEIVNEFAEHSRGSEEGDTLDRPSAVDWLAKMEEGSGSSEESDPGNASDNIGSERDRPHSGDPI